MSILEYNGGAIIGMTGKNCVAIASDTRLGAQLQTVSCDFQKIFKMHNKLFMGVTGLATDVLTLQQLLKFKINMYRLREEREIKPEAFSALLTSVLYEKRFGPYFTEPVVVGLSEKNEPFLSAMDLIGAPVMTKDFVVSGTCTNNLFGMCESMYRPDMEPDDLFETISQCLLASVDRDCMSGWGAVVHIITPDGIVSKKLKSRSD